MAVNFEHSFSDGMDWTRMLNEVRSRTRVYVYETVILFLCACYLGRFVCTTGRTKVHAASSEAAGDSSIAAAALALALALAVALVVISTLPRCLYPTYDSIHPV